MDISENLGDIRTGQNIRKIIACRLIWELKSQNLLYQEQRGSHPGSSTLDQIMYLQEHIQHNLSKRRRTLAVFLDITKGFDAAWRHHKII